MSKFYIAKDILLIYIHCPRQAERFQGYDSKLLIAYKYIYIDHFNKAF